MLQFCNLHFMLKNLVNFVVAILFLLSGVNLPSTSGHAFANTQIRLNEHKSPSTLNAIVLFSATLDEDENDELEEHISDVPFLGMSESLTTNQYYSVLNQRQAVEISFQYACIPVFLRNCSIRC